MSIRMALIAIAAAATAAAAGAQPDKDDRRPKAPPPTAVAPVVLASASDVRRPSTSDADRPAQPARRPAPRVTTCRCGDPQIPQDQSDDRQPDQ